MRSTVDAPPAGARATSGRTALGRYRLGALIGAGATARVHRAVDTRTGEIVAVKEIVMRDGLDRRVRAEVLATSRLGHRSIASLRDWGEDRGAMFLVWDLVDGPSLAELLAAEVAPEPVEVARLIADVLEGLAHAHGRGVIHRDLKPANILVGSDGRARLIDFGVALLVDETRITQIGASVGTIAYMSPEQATGGESTGATDVFGACLVLFEGLAGRNPLATGNAAATAQRAADCRIPDLARLRPDLPADLVRVVKDGLAARPADRPTAAQAARRLRAAIARMEDDDRDGRRYAGRRQAVLAGAGMAAAGGALGLQIAGGAGAASGAAIAGALGASQPAAAALLLLATALVWVGRTAPGMAVALFLAALALALPVRRRPALLAAPALAPVLFLSGAGLAYPLVAGALRRRSDRIWAALAGCAAVLWTQAWTGSGGLLFAGVDTTPARVALEGDTRPLHAIERILDPIRSHPAALAGGAIALALTLAVPSLRRVRPGGPRLLAATAWALVGLLTLTATPGVGGGPAAGAAIGFLAALAWASWPPRPSVRRPAARPSGTLGEIR